MVESVCWAFTAISILLLAGFGALAGITAASRYKTGRVVTPINLMIVGVFLSGTAFFMPVYLSLFSGEASALKSLLVSMHDVFQLFTINNDFSLIIDSAGTLSRGIADVYCVLGAVLYVFAPLLTFGFLLSFFKNISAYKNYIIRFFSKAYIFSELNEKALALAESIRACDKKALIVFTDAFENDEEEYCDFIERAKALGAVTFKKDILAVNFKLHSKKSEILFFAISEKESENIAHSLKLLKEYSQRENTRLYVFSAGIESELLLAHAEKGCVKVRRVDDVQSLINRILYEQGSKIFENAIEDENGLKHISAVVVGMGRYGTDMLRSLAWFCQMDGYRVTIDAFDRDEQAADKLAALCPELMSEEYNGVYVEGEAQYFINVHSGVDIDTQSFAGEIKKLSGATYVFVALGDDSENIKAAAKLRMMFERNGAKPVIQAVVRDSDANKALQGIKNYRGQEYHIDFIGDLKTSYSEKVIIDSELEASALSRHLKWGEEEEFWAYEYNYRSSMASAIHMSARITCKIPGAEKTEKELTPEENEGIKRLEHRRWNAYMRAEGYVYSGSPDKSSRNDLGKMHHDLINFAELSEEDKQKDIRVGLK